MPANDRLELKRMAVENTLAYNNTATIATVKRLGPDVIVKKAFFLLLQNKLDYNAEKSF